MIRAAVVSKNQSWRSFLRFAELQRGKRTGSVLAAADLDELLDIGDLGRHVGGVVRRVVCVTGRRDVVGGSCFCGMRR